ncbi:nuclear transport factor 2 family protein [Roseateles sp. BYS78W]|uniref:Nuclear transport factor 2 family protein n=1 Tax=Pelomonas candidula TaxID=3299025 RepID=A0ABW7H8K3_9BURK
MSTSSRTALDIIRAHYAASDRGNIDGMLVDMHPQVRWTEAAGFPYAGTYVGPEAVARGVFARIAHDWEGFGFHLEQLVGSGDAVVATGSYRGTCRGTGRAIDVRTAHVWKLADGRVTAFEQFTDTLLVDRAVGTK